MALFATTIASILLKSDAHTKTLIVIAYIIFVCKHFILYYFTKKKNLLGHYKTLDKISLLASDNRHPSIRPILPVSPDHVYQTSNIFHVSVIACALFLFFVNQKEVSPHPHHVSMHCKACVHQFFLFRSCSSICLSAGSVQRRW